MNDLDGILRELGQFGTYQIYTYILILFPLLLFSSGTVTYVFTTMDNDYRCLIPYCEHNDSQIIDQPWLQNAIPFENEKIMYQCLRYKPVLNSSNETCSREAFTSDTEECDMFIFGRDKNTITKEFGLLCERNKWKRTLVGTVNSFGMFIGMPIAGMVSDRFGRKTMILWSLGLAAVFGILRSLSVTYVQYVVFEFLDSVSHSGVFNAFYITGVEVVGPERRGLGGTIISSYYSLGEMLLGVIVMFSQDWRQYLRAVYLPMLFVAILYSTMLPESIRWLIARKRKDKVTETIEKIARWNKRPMTDEIRKTIDLMCSHKGNESKQKRRRKHPFKEVLKSKKLLLLVMCCSFCWVTVTFVYYGLSLNAVNIAGNQYWNFIFISFVEIPGYILSCFMINKCGRKISLCVGLSLSGIACSAFHFINEDSTTTRLILYFGGKLAITAASGTLYILASEIFPTYLRNSLLGFSSTVGRIGSISAPQVPLLAEYVDPVLVFGALSLVTAFLGLYFPETLNRPMPDSIKDAISRGKINGYTENRDNDPASKTERENIWDQQQEET